MTDLRLAEIAASGLATPCETRELCALLRLAKYQRDTAESRAVALQTQLSNARQRIASEGRVRARGEPETKQTKDDGESQP